MERYSSKGVIITSVFCGSIKISDSPDLVTMDTLRASSCCRSVSGVGRSAITNCSIPITAKYYDNTYMYLMHNFVWLCSPERIRLKHLPVDLFHWDLKSKAYGSVCFVNDGRLDSNSSWLACVTSNVPNRIFAFKSYTIVNIQTPISYARTSSWLMPVGSISHL